MYDATFPNARTINPRLRLPPTHWNSLPKGTWIWLFPWKKTPGWFGTGVELNVRSPALELVEPQAKISAEVPVELPLAAQYFVPNESGRVALRVRSPVIETLVTSIGPEFRAAEEIGEKDVRHLVETIRTRVLRLFLARGLLTDEGAREFAEMVEVSAATLYKWRARFEAEGPAGLADRQRGAGRGSLWRECAREAIFRGLDDARRRIALFIDHYNFQRPHQGIGGLVPADRYFEAAKEVRELLAQRVAANALELARNGEPRKPFYLTGRVGEANISLHAAVVLVTLGERPFGRDGIDDQDDIAKGKSDDHSGNGAPDDCETLGWAYCVANANSTGAPADIWAIGSASTAAGDMTLVAAPVPDDRSIFYHGPDAMHAPFGNSLRCVGGMIRRGSLVLATNLTTVYTHDGSGATRDLSAFVGTTRKFQCWFRDPMADGARFNTSSAVSVEVLP